MDSRPPTAAAPIVCFGEMLWDCLPSGAFPGGAPLNVAYHLHRQGAPVRLVSAVGADGDGDRLCRWLAGIGLPAAFVARHLDLPTGIVQAVTGPGGEVCYTIAAPVAWDRIEVDAATARDAAAAVFGSLALRSPANRHALTRLLAGLPPAAWRVFDVNLRPPHDDLARVRRQAAGVTLLKLNTAEAVRLAAAAGECPGSVPEEALARTLATALDVRHVCITAGRRGAGLLFAGRWHWEAGQPVAVADPVGAGDAFLATLLRALLAGAEPADALHQACRIGEWVASRPGATPAYESAPAAAR